MKNPRFSLLSIFTCIFIAFLIGFFLGRNLFGSDIQVSVSSVSVAETQPVVRHISASTNNSDDPIIDINTAGIHELASLPGIGESLAQRIVDYREANGPFSAPEELLNVSGIGSSKLEAILDKITTGG